MVDPQVHQAMASPLIGHTDPEFFGVLEDTAQLLRYVFGTRNEFTIAVPGTGSAGMESAVVNFVEEGSQVVVFANGYFSARFSEMCRRQGASVARLEKPWGEVYTDAEAREFLERERPQTVMFVHAETSTGAHQPAAAICRAGRECGGLIIADCVTSLGGMPVEVDRNGIDIAYSGTQKCLSAPPRRARTFSCCSRPCRPACAPTETLARRRLSTKRSFASIATTPVRFPFERSSRGKSGPPCSHSAGDRLPEFVPERASESAGPFEVGRVGALDCRHKTLPLDRSLQRRIRCRQSKGAEPRLP